MRVAIPAFGIGLRWLKEELNERGVNVRLTDSCLREILEDASDAASSGDDYAESLRHEIVARAEFLRAWTRSDERIETNDRAGLRMTSIARKYALPRAWTLHVPMASTAQHATPTYLNWASAG